MFKCHVCGSEEGEPKTVTQMFILEERPLMIEEVPASVCSRCGEAVFDISTVEKIRKMVHGDAKPAKTVMTDVFAYSDSTA